MNTVQLECFLSVVKYLNFSKAAESLKITQPAVSHQINSLEDELTTKLFNRTSKSVELTPAGFQFIGAANDILKISHSAKKRLCDNALQNLLFLRIGVHNQFEMAILPPILQKLKQDFKSFHPVIKLIPFQVLENLLTDDTIHIMLGYKNEQQKKTPYIYQELIKCPIVCVCSSEYPLSSYKVLKNEDLVGNMVLCEPYHVPLDLFHFQNQISAKRSTSDIMLSDGYESAITLVKACFGFTLIPNLQIIQESGLSYVPIEGAPSISYGLYYKSLKGNNVLKQFVTYCKEAFALV